MWECLDEDIPYLQYPAKQQQQIVIAEEAATTTTTNLAEVSAPLVVKLSGDEPLPAVIPHPQPIVPGKSLPFSSFSHSSI